ncbi:MAG: methyltransferase [Ruthenibacterium sp.]
MNTEILAHGTAVCVDDTHTFGADALLLAHFCALRPQETAADFGTGCGIIPLRWHDRGHRGTCVAIDCAQSALTLLQTSLAANEICHITPLCANLNTLVLPQLFDVIACNPPYFHGGKQSQNAARALARQDANLTLSAVCRVAHQQLKRGGRLCISMCAARLAELLFTAEAAHLTPTRLRLVAANAQKAPWLVLLEVQKDGADTLTFLPTLLADSAEMQQIYDR